MLFCILGDMAAIGTSLTKYQRQKLVMAPGEQGTFSFLVILRC